jgi:tetratricopeptide (TPR) repeat protein
MSAPSPVQQILLRLLETGASVDEVCADRPDLRDEVPHLAWLSLGSSLRLQGRPAEARQFLEQGVSRLPEVHDLRAFAEYQIEQCKVEQSAEEGLEAALAGSRVSEDAGEQVQFALLCMRRDRHAEALRFFGDAFRLDPAAAGDWASSRRYDAACTAAILAGVGSESAATDGAALLAQAYDSLEADLGEM